MKKCLYILAALCLIFSVCILLSSCNFQKDSLTIHSNISENTSDTKTSQTEAVSLSYNEQLERFNNLTVENIQKIDIVRVNSESGKNLLFKSFSDTKDIYAILDVFNDADVQSENKIEDTNGWTTLVKICTKDNYALMLITPKGDNSVSIDDYVYSANEDFEQKLIDLYNNSEIKEEVYT